MPQATIALTLMNVKLTRILALVMKFVLTMKAVLLVHHVSRAKKTMVMGFVSIRMSVQMDTQIQCVATITVTVSVSTQTVLLRALATLVTD